MALDPEVHREIAAALDAHGAKQPCPRCDTNTWVLLDGFLNHSGTDKPGTVVLGGTTIPTIALICRNCGFLSLHSAVILGVEPSPSISHAPKSADENTLNSAAGDEA
jgi:hypothetical protein